MAKMLFNALLNTTNVSTPLSPTYGYQIVPTISLSELVASITFYAMLMIAVVMGNTLVTITFTINRAFRTPTNSFIFSLAISDLLIGLVSIPIYIKISFLEYDSTLYLHPTLISVFTILDILTGCSSILHLCFISLERCHAIMYPLAHRSLSNLIYVVVITVAWIYPIFIASLFFVQLGNWEKEYTGLVLITCFVVPLLVIFVSYTFLFRKARHPQGLRSTEEKNASAKELKIAMTIFVITGLFIICWAPYFVTLGVMVYCFSCLPTGKGLTTLSRFVKWMQYSNSAINPVIYSLRNKEMRRTCRWLYDQITCGRYNLTNQISPGASQRISYYNRTTIRRVEFNSSAEIINTCENSLQKNGEIELNGKL